MGNYGKVRYNGNISAMNWTYRTDTDTIVNGYRFTYDAYDRLASAYSVTGSDFPAAVIMSNMNMTSMVIW